MGEFFTWATLATSAGAVMLTAMVTEALKGVKFIEKIPTRVFSYVISLIILLAANFFTGALDVQTVGICVVNAVVVALAANGGFDAVKKALGQQKE